MHALFADLRFAIRQLRKAPVFAATVLLTFAIGIGATTAMFTLVYDVLLKPLPYPHAEQLVMMEEQVAEFRDIYPTLPLNANHFTFWKHHAETFQSLAAMRQDPLPVGGGTRPLQVQVLRTTGDLFQVLETQPVLGRTFSAQEEQPDHSHVVILLDKLWREQYGADPKILGKTIPLNGFPYTVVGVMGPKFHLPILQTFASADSTPPLPAELIVPLAFRTETLQQKVGDHNFFGLGRLRPGVSPGQANAEINALQKAIMRELAPNEKATLSAVLTPFQQALVGSNRKALLLLLAAVAGLLLVGCVNITNLLLSRAAGQRQALAVAQALGASRAETLRMVTRETAVLAALGGPLGIGLAAAILPAMQRYLPPALDFRGALHLDPMGALFALALTTGATLLTGAAPAWIAARTAPHEVLQSESRLGSESTSSRRLRRLLVGAEVAVSMALVVMTGLLITSVSGLLRVDRGFEASHMVTATLNLPEKSYPTDKDRIRLIREAMLRLDHLPSVEGVAGVSVLPLTGDSWIDMIDLPGDTRATMQLPTEHFRWITPGYFEVLHLPLKAGRSLTAGDEGKPYVVISELTARTLWPGREAVGQQFRRGDHTEAPFTVIGVVGDARTISLSNPDPMMVYVPYWYRNDAGVGVLVRTRQDSGAMADEIRRGIWSLDPEIPIPEIRSMDRVVANSVASRNFEMRLLLLFAVSALVLAGLGIFGVVNYSVVQRQREIGLRMALGAQRAHIYQLVMIDGLLPVLLGGAAGIAMAFSFGRLLQSLLFQASPWNTTILLSSVGLLGLTGIVASSLPARRATVVEPMLALKTE